MSFLITDTTGLRKSGLSVDTTGWAGVCLGIWTKFASANYMRGVCIQSTADVSRPSLSCQSDGGGTPYATGAQAGGTGDIIYSSTSISADTWTFHGGSIELSTGTVRVYHGTAVNSVSTGITAGAFSAETMNNISVGVLYDSGGTETFSSAAVKYAQPFVAKRLPTTGASSELEALAGGAHPLAVFGSDLLDYWAPNSKTSALNGWVLADIGGSITIDTGDNPTLDDPPSEGGGVTLTQIERGRVLARGLTRGLA